jgi:hypothetical protein
VLAPREAFLFCRRNNLAVNHQGRRRIMKNSIYAKHDHAS